MSRKRGPVTQEWIHELPFMQQSVLILAMRGPDGVSKYGAAKMLLRWYRRCVIKAAFLGEALRDPIQPSGGSFDGPSLEGDDELDPWTERMMVHVNQYLRELDGIPHHFHMHLMHGTEILGYKHPDAIVRHWWHCLYLRLANDAHLHPESEAELDVRLGDSRDGWLHRADPATVA